MTTAPQYDALVSDPVFPVTFRAISEGIYGNGVRGETDLEATSGAGSFDVDVSGGTAQYDGSTSDYAGGSVTLDAPGDDVRWDTIYYDMVDEQPAVRKGTPGLAPIPEDIVDDEVLIAYAAVDPAASSVEDSDLRNWRSRPQPADNTPYGGSGGDTVSDALDSLFGGKADDPHGNGSHTETFAVDGDQQPPETHGNGSHSTNYSAQGHDHTGESISPDDVSASSASVTSEPSGNNDVARKAEIDAIDDRTQIDSIAVQNRSDLPDPTTLDRPTRAYIADEDVYVSAYQQ